VYADRAVEILRAKGRRARRLLEGFPEWKAAGFPVHTGVERVEDNTAYQFISDRAQRATAKFGVKSVSILARKP